MTILTFGINHKTAPIDVRERLAFAPGETPEALQDLLAQPAVNEAVLLSTCNRTEIYTTPTQLNVLQNWLQEQRSITGFDLSPYCYSYYDADAIKHLIRVACGLDSMVLGEPEILGQVKRAFQLAHEQGGIGQHLQSLFPAVFAATKEIRFKTAIGQSPVSFAYASTHLAKRIFTRLSDCQVLLIGAGETIELAATHFHSQGVKKLLIANRTIDKAQQLAEQFHARAIRIGDIPAYLPDTQIVVSATASQLPILGKGLIERVLKNRKRQPLFMVDLALPRDIEPEAAELEDAYLYNLDDLQAIIQENLKHRERAAEQAEVMVDIQVQNYLRQLRVHHAGDTIRNYRDHMLQIRTQELKKARLKLQQGIAPEQVLDEFAHNLVNKMVHKPTIKLREAARDERIELLQLAKELFDL